MPDKKETERKKIVVEEVVSDNSPEAPKPESQIEENAGEVIQTPKEENYETENIVEVPQTPIQTQDAVAPRLITPIERPSTGPSPLLIIIPGLFLLGGLLGGIVFYQSKVSQTALPAPTPITEIVVEETPSPTPSMEVDLKEFSIKVLNGSGTAGEAGKVEAILNEAGFEVASTGNASNYSYTRTVIQAKTAVSKEFLAKLTETLSGVYSVDSKTQSLSSSSTEDVVVIVGSTKN